jgi:hypothetical protein
MTQVIDRKASRH